MFWRQNIKTKMAAELPKWLVSARGVSTASKTEEQKEKAKTKNQKRYEARKRRVNRKREAKLAKLLMGMEEQINKVQVDMRELIDAEKERSQRFLSLARKYYGMWKTLNEKCQGKSVWKSPRSQMQYSTSNVSSCFAFIKTRTNRISTSCLKSRPSKKFHDPTQLVHLNQCHFWQI